MVKPWEEKKAWKAARKLTGSVYRVTEARDFEEDVDLRRQVRRASASMLAEIAQLYESPGRPDMLRSLRDARSSVTRLQSQLYVAGRDQSDLVCAHYGLPTIDYRLPDSAHPSVRVVGEDGLNQGRSLMNDWEGQVIAAAARELLGAFRSLARDGFGLRDRALLSAVIRDLLSVDPNISRAEATLKAVEAIGAKPSPEDMLAAVKKRKLLEGSERSVAGRKLLAGPRGERIPPGTRFKKRK
jgi:four helix bundle protein